MNIKPTNSVFEINASVVVAAAFISSSAFISGSALAAAPVSTQVDKQSSSQQLNTLIEIALSQDSNRKQYFA